MLNILKVLIFGQRRKKKLAGKPIPEDCFLNLECLYLGARDGEKRWSSQDAKRLYTWDSMHGEIEVYNKRGKHLGVVDTNGDWIKEAVKGRTIDV